MFSYEGGIAVGFLLWLLSAILLLVSINSRFERNLNKVGQRLSWLTQTPKEMSADDKNQATFSKIIKFLFIVGIGLSFVLFSWLHVAMIIGTFIYQRARDSGAPQAVREFRWKLKNIDMSFDQIVKELMKISDQDASTFETVRDELHKELKDRGVLNG